MSRARPGKIDADALLCALVIAPQTYSRNRFFKLYEDPTLKRTRRRAAHVRGIVRQLLGEGRLKAEIVGEQVLDDGRVLLRYRVEEISFTRTTALSQLEAAALRYALHRAGAGPVQDDERRLVERALARLSASEDRARG